MKLLSWLAVFVIFCGGLYSSLLWANPAADFLWQNFSPANTGIPGDRILFADFDPSGHLWVGACNAARTVGGVARFDGRRWNTWSNLDSPLPSACVYSAAFDSSGIVWLGTDGGLVRFDGPYWTVSHAGNSPLPASAVRDLQLDLAGHLWMTYHPEGEQGGVAMLDRSVWTLWSAAEIGFDPATRPTSLAIDAAGDIWVGSEPSGGIARYNWADWTVLNGDDGFSDAAARALRTERDGHLWLNWNGPKFYDGQAWQKLSPPVTVGLCTAIRLAADSGIWLGSAAGKIARRLADRWQTWDLGHPLVTLTLGADGSPWCATLTGIQRLNADGGWTLWNSYNTGLADWAVRDVSLDDRGRAWIATAQGGLSVFDGAAWQGLNPLCGQTRLWPFHTSAAEDVLCARDGSVWVALGEEGLGQWNGASWSHYLRGQFVACLAEALDGSLWAGLHGGAARFDGADFALYGPADGIPGATVDAICADRAGGVWVGTPTGLARFDGRWRAYDDANSGLPQRHVTALAADPSGDLWVGTTAGLARFDGEQWETYTESNSGLPAAAVTSLACSDEGELWVGAYDERSWPQHGGAARYDGLTWATFTPANTPLPSERVSSITVDHRGNAWIGTGDHGVALLQRAPEHVPGSAVYAAAQPAPAKPRPREYPSFSAMLANR